MMFLDLLMAAIMLLFGLYYYKSKGKAANFLTGYNMRSDEERKNYDEMGMCKSYGIKMMTMAIPFIIGAIIDCFTSGTGFIIAWGCWIVLFVLLLIDRSKREKAH